MSLTTEQLADLPAVAAAAICDERTRRPWASDAELIDAVALRLGSEIGERMATASECEEAVDDAMAEGKMQAQDEMRNIIERGFNREDSNRDILRALCKELGIEYRGEQP